MDRRAFLGGAKQFAAQGLAAAALFESLRPNYGRAEQIPKDDKRIKAEFVTVSSPQGNENIKRYPVRPANAAAKLPDVIVIHENRGAAAWHRELHGIRARWPDERR